MGFHKMAGPAGFEPAHARIKTWCLTAWRRPNNTFYYLTRLYAQALSNNHAYQDPMIKNWLAPYRPLGDGPILYFQ